MTMLAWIICAAVSVVSFFIGHFIGKWQGKNIAKFEGAVCDVCDQIKPKFVSFRMTIMCMECYQKVLANKEMQCKFCNQPIEACKCTE